MSKRPVIFIILISALLFITGCSSPAQQSAEPAKVGPARVESPQAEPNTVKIAKTEPNLPQMPKPEPNQPEPNKVGPAKLYTHKTESNEVPIAETKLPKTEPNKSESLMVVSFQNTYADVLKSCVDDRGMVDYKTLAKKKREIRKLLEELVKLDPNEYNSWPKEDKIAFWINAYNIQMLRIITDNYPIDGSRILNILWGPYSIRHIKGIWTDYKFIVMDEEFTLSEIEQRFFHKEFAEPRIFFAISYACLSSPPLRNQPYSGSKLNEQLDEQVKKFLSNPLAFRIDRGQHAVYLSAMFQPGWYGKDFVDKYGTDKKFKAQEPATRAVLNFIANYIPKQDASFLEVENYTINYMNYDWTLNDSSIKQ